MNFGFFTDQDATRYCHLRLRRLKAAIKEPKILDALVRELEVTEPVSALTPAKKLAAIERRIEVLRATKASVWFGVPAPEVLAASIFKAADLADGTVADLFTSSRNVEALVGPVKTWLTNGGLTLVQDIVFGERRIKLGGYRTGMMSGPRVVAVQVENELDRIDVALDELRALAPYTSASYLACTPALAAAYLVARASTRRWDREALHRKLRESGTGLLLVERDAVSQPLVPKERPLDLEKVKPLLALIPKGS